MSKAPSSLGNFLFRWRGLIGFLAFWVVYLISHPTLTSCIRGLLLILLGIIGRFWAVGYLGNSARNNVIGGQVIVRNGPYRFFPHPIYLSNLFLVLGMLLALNSPLWISGVVIFGFFVEYGVIARTEERFLKSTGLPEVKRRFSWHNGLVEWRTWLTVVGAYLLALLKQIYF